MANAGEPRTPGAVPQPQDTQALIRHLGSRLQETKREPLALLARIVHSLGPERATALAEQALTLYAGEGMLTVQGDRKRTAGGIFFYLAKLQASPKQQQRIQFWLGSDRRRPRKPMNARPGSPAQPKAQAPREASKQTRTPSLAEVVAQARTEQGAGTLSTTSIKLIGRPGQVQTEGALTFLVLTAQHVPALPKQIPARESGTKYLVIIGNKQWQRISGELEANAEARFVIEGYPTVQAGFPGIAVAALNCALVVKGGQEP